MLSNAHEAYRSPLANWRDAEHERARNSEPGLTLTDLSHFYRVGFKGRGTIAAMQANGITVEATPNKAYAQSDGSLCLVLGATEVLLLATRIGNTDRLRNLEHNWSMSNHSSSYLLPRHHSHAWISVSGTKTAEFFSKICAVDLRLKSFINYAIAQTQVAKLNTIILRADQKVSPSFHLLFDAASAIYFVECLVDAAQEFDPVWVSGITTKGTH